MFKNFIDIIIWPVIFIIGQFVIIVLSTFGFNLYKISKLKETFPNQDSNYINNLFDDMLNTSLYKQELAQFLNDTSLLIAIVSIIIFVPIFLKILKRVGYYKQKLDFSNLACLISLGIFLAVFLNIIIYSINEVLFISNRYSESIIDKNVLITVLTIGILGPVIEELLYRGVVYNKCKKVFSCKKSIFLTTIIFSLVHGTILQMIYAFIIGIILIYVYEKYKSLKAPIILHIALNITTILLTYIIGYSLVINVVLFIISIIVLILVFYLIKMYNNKYIG